MRVRTAEAIALLVLAAATSSACVRAPEESTSTPVSQVEQAKLPEVTAGSNLTDAITEAHCARTGKGVWTSSGVIENPTDKTLDLDVTIFIGPANGQTGQAHVTRINDLKPGKKAQWSESVVETNFPDAPCHLQVRVAKK